MIDENTSRADLLDAIYSEHGLIDACIAQDFEPEDATDAQLLAFIRAWIEAGDECRAA